MQEGELPKFLSDFANYSKDMEMVFSEEVGASLNDCVEHVKNSWQEKKSRCPWPCTNLNSYAEWNEDDEDLKNKFWIALFWMGVIRGFIFRKDWGALRGNIDQLSKCHEELKPNIEYALMMRRKKVASNAAKQKNIDLQSLKALILERCKDVGKLAQFPSVPEFLSNHVNDWEKIANPFRERAKAGESTYIPPDPDNMFRAISSWRIHDRDFKEKMDFCLDIKRKPKG